MTETAGERTAAPGFTNGAAPQPPGQPQAAEGPPSVDSDWLTRSAGRGALWQLGGGAWQSGVQLLASMVLARMLSPADYGLMGMAVLVQGFIARLGALGTGLGVIAKKDVTDDDLCTGFWMNLALQGSMFLAGLLGAPLAASFFGQPELTLVLRTMSVMFLLNGATSISGVLLTKRLQFGRKQIIAGAAAIAQVVVAIVIALAISRTYWALVWGLVISTALGAVSRFFCAGWWPKLRFSGASFRHLFRWSVSGLGTSVVSYFQSNLDYLLVGRMLSATALGFYEFAYRIPHMLLNRAAYPVGVVLFPTLAAVRGNDERLAAGYIKTARYLAFLVLPALFGLACVARPAVVVLWGEQWTPAILPLRVLCFGAAIRCLLSPVGNILLCKDRPGLLMILGLGATVFTFGVVALLGYLHGLTGIAVGMLLATLPSMFTLWLAFRMTHTRVRRLLSALAPPVAAASICAAAALGTVIGLNLRGLSYLIILPAAIGAGAAVYFAVLWLCYPGVVKEILQTVRVVAGRQRVHPN